MAPAPDEEPRPPPRGTVGVYDRPASADRPPWLARAAVGVVAAAAALAGWWFWPG